MRSFLALVLAAFCVCPIALAQTTAAPPAYRSDAKFQKALAEAQTAKPGKDALSAWKHANKAAGGACTECLHGMVVADVQLSKFKDLIVDADALAAVATTPNDKYLAAAEAGTGYLLLDRAAPKPKNLELADARFKAAIVLAPHAQYVRFQDGRVLSMLHQDEAARALFVGYVKDAKPNDPLLHRAQHFAAKPELAAMPQAPAFTVRTTTGQTISLSDLTGKVVLVDFWASWCGPCRETIPELKKLTEKFAGQPLVVLSVSIDSDDSAWKKAMKEEGMDWPQYRDSEGLLATTYGVTAIPRFFAIDSDGILREAELGAGNNIQHMVSGLLREARDPGVISSGAETAETAGQ